MLQTPVPEWVAQLDAPDPTAAIRALGEHGAAAREAVEPLRAIMLNDPSWPTRQQALEALSRIEPLPTTSATQALADEYPAVRIAAAQILAYSSRPLPEATYAGMMADVNHIVRGVGFRALERAGDAAAPFFDDMVAGLADPRPYVRTAATRAIGATGEAGRAAIGVLTERLEDANGNVIAAAADVLCRLGTLPPDTLEALRSMTQKGYVWVRSCDSQLLQAR